MYIAMLFFAHIPFVVNRKFNATPMERLQQNQKIGNKFLSSAQTITKILSNRCFNPWMKKC